MTTTLRLDGAHRIVLSRDLRRAAGIAPRQALKASAVPGRIILEAAPQGAGKIEKRGRLKVWTGAVPRTPLAQAVEAARRYDR